MCSLTVVQHESWVEWWNWKRPQAKEKKKKKEREGEVVVFWWYFTELLPFALLQEDARDQFGFRLEGCDSLSATFLVWQWKSAFSTGSLGF